MYKKALVLLISFMMIFSFCASAYSSDGVPEVVSSTPGSGKWNEKVDYSDPCNWLALPDDPAKDADLIYFYPTVYTPAEGSGEVLADIGDEGMRVKAAASFDKQATAFSECCNLYAPFYRQLDAVYALTLTESETADLIRYSASQDASAALDYYFEHFNNGRPFILAGHSQGSQISVYLLADYFAAHPDYYERMVAAYIIGYSVTESFLNENPHTRFAEGETDTGVIVSWNTEAPENIGQHNAVVLAGARSINPVNWKTDDTYASAGENKGSRINGEYLDGIADAQIDLERGTVITNADKSYAMPPNPLFGPASFHLNDYDLFYSSISENAKKRIGAFSSRTSVEDADASGLSADRLQTVASIRKLSDFDSLNLYSMEVFYDYDLDDLLSPPGEYDDAAILGRILAEAAPGMHLRITLPDFGCSAFTLEAADGNVYMGRNYDFRLDTSAMQVYCHPKDGYASVSYAALDNLKVDDPFVSDQSLAACLAAPFTCLDGMNEKGVAIAVLSLPSEPTRQNTGKRVIPTAVVIRLVLDRAATTQEAVDLIAQYDMYCTNGHDYHYYITDASGDGRIVEYDPEKEDRPMVTTPIRTITNYYGMFENKVISGQDNGIYGTGMERRERIESEIAMAGDSTSRQTAWAGLRAASTAPDPESLISNTQWSIVYDLTDLSHEFVLHRRWESTFAFRDLAVPA